MINPNKKFTITGQELLDIYTLTENPTIKRICLTIDQRPKKTSEKPMRVIEVERCWGINKENPRGCPFARFMTYETGFFCEKSKKDCWQIGRDDPKIVHADDGFPDFCELKRADI